MNQEEYQLDFYKDKSHKYITSYCSNLIPRINECVIITDTKYVITNVTYNFDTNEISIYID